METWPFQCALVLDFVAVGFGNNKTERIRAIRIAALVCYELQVSRPVVNSAWYKEFPMLMSQVRSAYSFNVRRG